MPGGNRRIVLQPVGCVEGGRIVPEDDNWDASRAVVALDADRFTPASLRGLDGFSHVEVVFLFDQVAEQDVTTDARRPRGRSDWPEVGIFAQRGRNRPNRIGVSTCRLVSVSGLRLEVQGLDAVHGTPVLDVKPVMRGFLPRGALREPAWATEIMARYWKDCGPPPWTPHTKTPASFDAGAGPVDRGLSIGAVVQKIALPAIRPSTRKIRKITMAMKNRVLAIPAVAADTPEKPKMPAMIEMTRNSRASFNMVASYLIDWFVAERQRSRKGSVLAPCAMPISDGRAARPG